MNKGKLEQFMFYALLGLFLIVSLIPFSSLLHIRLFNLPLHYLIVGGGVFLLVIVTWWAGERKFYSFDLWLGIVLFAFALSLITSVNRGWTIRSLGSFFLRGGGVAFVASRLVNSKERRRNFTYVLLIGGSLVCLIGLVEFFLGRNPLFHQLYLTHNPYYPLGLRSGMVSTIGHPLPLAAWLVLLLPLSLKFGHDRKFPIGFIPFLLILATICFSFTRSAWFAGAVAFFCYFLKKESRKISKKNLSILLLIPILVLPLFFFSRARNTFHRRFNIKRIKQEVLSSHRSASYTTTLNIVKNYPLFGGGMGNYPQLHKKYRAKRAAARIETPDNMYLRLLSETGIVGLGTFLVFIIFTLYRFWRNSFSGDGFRWAIFCGLVGFLINLFASDLFYWLAPQFTFWLLLGAGVGIRKHGIGA